ncbi:MAG: DUF4442 domain-containing protein [Ferruginibacter sp.]
MSIYQKLTRIGSKFAGMSTLLKTGLNLSPMYRRSTAKVLYVSEDMMHIKIRLSISYKNRNYMNTIFGGSMFAAVDPIPMMQYVNLLGKDYVVWDKSAEIFFRRPAKEDLYASFDCTPEEIAGIKDRIEKEQSIDIVKKTQLTGKDGSVIFCEVNKTIYIADKTYYKNRRTEKNKS